ncbi:MAG: putative lipoprotein [Myxococcota bacterium]
MSSASLNGCASSASDSLSESSGSISDSFSSPFESSSDSSGGDDARYRGDVEDYTVASLETLGPFDAKDFARGLANIAEAHGLSDWAALDGTYRAVGAGLARGGLAEGAAVGVARSWLGGDARVRRLVVEGWRAATRAS